MSMKKKYPARLNIPVTQEMKDWVIEESGGDGFMASFARKLLTKAIAVYAIQNEHVKPTTLVIDTED